MTITSRQNPLVARFRTAARGDVGGVILLDGAHLVADAIAAKVTFQLAAVTPASAEETVIRDLVDTLERSGVEVITVSSSVMGAVSPVKTPTGIVALAERPGVEDDQLYAGQALVVAAVDVQDPGNLGAIIRVAEAAGATGFVAAGGSANPFGWKALRGSMGSALRLPIASEITPDEAVADAKRHRCRVIAAVPRDGRSVYDADLSGSITLLIGGEGQGLSRELTDGADERVTIPMQAPVESLNAAVTAALIVYEARRQRTRIQNS
ncbi:MAG: putative TrmH family tRNA/rRNA methyltransferase [Acidobacteria bacterium]|nr:putative TrmH family tRNA/rRNA methyltransferase [Acidobacteriota bacterium]